MGSNYYFPMLFTGNQPMKPSKKKPSKLKYPILINNDEELDDLIKEIIVEELEAHAEREMNKTFKKNKKSGKVPIEEREW